MSLDNAVWLLTGLAAVVVLLTRLRLSSEQSQAGHARVPLGIVRTHTVVGVAALLVWIAYLISPDDTLGTVALAVWWVEVAVGLLILTRWLSGSGKHATATSGDSWGDGPSLSILGHVGMLLGVGFFTWVVLADKLS